MHKPRKRFGQNFLRDTHMIMRIVDCIVPTQSEHLVEIGPGEGAMTRELLERTETLDVIELDRDLIVGLELLKLKTAHALNIHQADALKFDYISLAKKNEKLTIVGNLPYNISTPLLFHLFSQKEQIERMVFMLQKEVVDRLVAKVGTKAYGRLSVMAQFYCQIEKQFDVPPDVFFPQPKVNSAIVELIPYETSPFAAVDVACLSALVTKSFSQRRKTLRNVLKGVIDFDKAESLGIDLSKRAEALSVEDYIMLSGEEY